MTSVGLTEVPLSWMRKVFCLCWLLAVSVRQMWPLRTPSRVSCALPILQMSGRMRYAFTCSSSQRGNVHCAWLSHPHQAVDRRLSSVTPPPICAWTKPDTISLLTRFSKRDLAKVSDHFPSTGEMALHITKLTASSRFSWRRWFRPANKPCSSSVKTTLHSWYI